MRRMLLWFRIKYSSWRSGGAWTYRCWFCGEYGSNNCAVCDRELCECCAKFHDRCQEPFTTRYRLSA